jgi:type IX secretion system PorP/SprF family membrane protein
MGGYRIPFGADLRLEPSVLLRYVDPVPSQADLTATLRYRDMVWVGATYRTQDAVCLTVGYWLKRTFQFGYSYDMTTSDLQRYSSGTHEVMLAVTFGKQRRRPPVDPLPTAP